MGDIETRLSVLENKHEDLRRDKENRWTEHDKRADERHKEVMLKLEALCCAEHDKKLALHCKDIKTHDRHIVWIWRTISVFILAIVAAWFKGLE